MLRVGELDRITAIVGERGMGKSTLAKIDARAFQRETGGYVIGHSPNGQIGSEKDIVFHDRMDGWRGLGRGLKREPGKMHFLTTGAAEQIIGMAEGLSLSIRKAAFKRARPMERWNEHRPLPKDIVAPPVLVVIDEGTSMRRHPSQTELESLERLLVNARHKHIAFTWSIQSPTARQWILFEQANRLRVFRYTHEWGANSLRAAGIPKEIIGDLHDLPRFAYFRLDKGSDSSSRYEVLPKP